MKLALKKHLLTREDFEDNVFVKYNFQTIEMHLVHNTYNRFLQYYLIELIYDATNACRTKCDCKSRLVKRTILEECDGQCEQLPDEEKFEKYIKENLASYRNKVYAKFDEWIYFQRFNCDNECKLFSDIDFADLLYPKMDCLCDNQIIKDFLEFNDTEELKEHILKITEYLDYKLPDDEADDEIEALKWFEFIEQFNELKLSQWPKMITLSGYRINYDGAEGDFYQLDEKIEHDLGIILNIKGICYKRWYVDTVDANWFGVKYFDKHTEILSKLLSYDIVNLQDLTFNVEIEETLQRPVNNNINWFGNNAIINIDFKGANCIIDLQLLQDIYQIKIEGLNIFVNADDASIPFFNMNDDFEVGIFFFNSKLQSATVREADKYLTIEDETIKSDIFWEVLPYIQDLGDDATDLSFINLNYINQLKATTVDSVLLLDSAQNIEVKYTMKQSPKSTEESQYGDNLQPLLKKYLNETYLESVVNKYIDKWKQTIVQQMQVHIKDGMIFANTVDNGYIGLNTQSGVKWEEPGTGNVNQDFHKLFNLPNYMNKLASVEEKKIILPELTKTIPFRLFQYKENNAFEPKNPFRNFANLSDQEYDYSKLKDLKQYEIVEHGTIYWFMIFIPYQLGIWLSPDSGYSIAGNNNHLLKFKQPDNVVKTILSLTNTIGTVNRTYLTQCILIDKETCELLVDTYNTHPLCSNSMWVYLGSSKSASKVPDISNLALSNETKLVMTIKLNAAEVIYYSQLYEDTFANNFFVTKFDIAAEERTLKNFTISADEIMQYGRMAYCYPDDYTKWTYQTEFNIFGIYINKNKKLWYDDSKFEPSHFDPPTILKPSNPDTGG